MLRSRVKKSLDLCGFQSAEPDKQGKDTFPLKIRVLLRNIGLPLFFLLKDSAGTSLAAMAMIVVMLPCFLFAMYEKHGQPLEVIAKNIIQTRFIRPKERPYRTENLYAVLERQRNLEKEVAAIVKKTGSTGAGSRPRKGKTKADPRRKETD